MQRPGKYEPQLGISGHNGRASLPSVEEPSIGDLLRRLTSDSSHLMRQQFELAKMELKETSTRWSQAATKLGVAMIVALSGALALTASLVIGLGDLIDNYWASALMVGATLSIAAMFLVRRALAVAREDGLGLDDTAGTLREDAQWAKKELRNFKRELTA